MLKYNIQKKSVLFMSKLKMIMLNFKNKYMKILISNYKIKVPL